MCGLHKKIMERSRYTARHACSDKMSVVTRRARSFEGHEVRFLQSRRAAAACPPYEWRKNIFEIDSTILTGKC